MSLIFFLTNTVYFKHLTLKNDCDKSNLTYSLNMVMQVFKMSPTNSIITMFV